MEVRLKWSVFWCAVLCVGVFADDDVDFLNEPDRVKAYCDDIYKKCENGGKCAGTGHERFCQCLPGTGGDFCATVDDCDNHVCGSSIDVVCMYDPSISSAVCICKDKYLSFDRVEGRCRVPCTVNEDCENAAPCLRKGLDPNANFTFRPDDQKYCRCHNDTSGNNCEKVDACDKGKKLCGEEEDAVCSFDPYLKKAVCTCWNSTQEFDYGEKICKDCDCGNRSLSCSWATGKKTCECEKGYYDVDGTCTDCKCGPKSDGCSLEGGEKKCHCFKDFQQKGGQCEYCSCRKHWTACQFVGDEVKCTCEEGYAQKEGICVDACQEDSQCKNGGKCQDNICNCLKNTGGAFCQIVTGCEYDNPCPPGIPCKYDNRTQGVFCECPDPSYVYFEEQKKCIGSCDNDTRKCENGGSCSKKFSEGILICDCPSGTYGDLCEKVEKCEKNFYQVCGSGRNKTCYYDQEAKDAACKCGENQKFIGKDKPCKTLCSESGYECKHGGECNATENFCNCHEGFSGDLCQIIDACVGESPLCGRRTSMVSCEIREGDEDPKCYCKPDEDKKYDKIVNRCRYQCSDDDECQHEQKCTERDFGKFCACGKGLEGDKCETVTACKNNKCGDGADVECFYDANSIDQAICECTDAEKQFDPDLKTCRKMCNESNPCQHSSTCEKSGENSFCKCKRGLSGDFCDTVDACTKCGNATGVLCLYNATREDVDCECEEEKKHFDRITKMCRVPCDFKDNRCENSANCMPENYIDKHLPEPHRRYCQCFGGTSGDRCERVDDCEDRKVDCGTGNDTLCLYDWRGGRAYCGCQREGFEFNYKAKECMKCDCGPMSFRCDYYEGEKNCGCKDGFYAKDGYCQDCSCGAQSGGCNYQESTEEVTCQCNPGFSQNRTYCEACYCGSRSKGCSFYKGKMQCHCEQGYVEKDDFCQAECNETSKCLYGGECKDGLCICRRGTAGIFCQIIVDCSNNEICGRDDNVLCLYNETDQKAYCACNQTHYMYDESSQQCKECDCGTKGVCALEGGEKKCKCIENYGEMQGKCTECNCGDEAINCTFVGKKAHCECKKGFADKDGNCTECDCGDHGQCLFRKGKKTCVCEKNFAEKNETCIACECGENSEGCEFKGEDVRCSCSKGFLQFKEACKACDCGAKGTCSFDKDGNPKCNCRAGHAEKGGICVEQCRDDCMNGGECKKEEKYKFCSCLAGTSGDLCKTVDDCADTYRDCKGDFGTCKFNVTSKEAYCYCPDKTLYDDELKRCRISCSNDTECEHGAKCVDALCACPEGTSGDTCAIVDGCKALEEECKQGKRVCKYAPDRPQKAKCVCSLQEFEYHEGKKQCVPIWCLENPCAADAVCAFSMMTKTGYCVCKDKTAYYNHTAQACEAVDGCLFNTDCKKFEVCEDGVCKCRPYHKATDKGCEPYLCQNHLCYYIKNSQCKETDIVGNVKCVCEDKYYFDGAVCTYGACLMPGQWASCYVDCPDGMEKTDTGCQAQDEKNRCSKNCGKFGWCMKEGGFEVCKCLQKYALLKNDVCVLDASTVCASKKLSKTDFSKCECSGIYKYADDGITCEKRSCNDTDVRDECKRVGAVECKDNWDEGGGNIGFECLCGPGYSKNADKICTEKCKLESHIAECAAQGQTCFLDDMFNANCRCPPTFSWDPITKRCDALNENSFMIHNLTILRKKYMLKEASLDVALLNADIVRAMKNVYQKKVLDYAYLFDYTESGDELNCSVVLQLKDSSKWDIDRFRFYSTIDLNCTDCNLLPPLVLKKGAFETIGVENLSLCSDSLKQYLCGTGSECQERKCSCSKGYRPLVPTIQKTNDYTIMRCEDIDECAERSDSCSSNTTCINTPGDYYCKCKPGFKKSSDSLPYKNQANKEGCVDLCTPNPCSKGSCAMKENKFDCSCEKGYKGSLCDSSDEFLKDANINSKIIGGVLGAFLAVTVLAFVLYVLKVRKDKSNSEADYVPSTRAADNAEMSERRGIRGASNHGYE